MAYHIIGVCNKKGRQGTSADSLYGNAHPVIYSIDGSIARTVRLLPEGVVRHRQILRLLRSKTSNLNFVTKDHIPVSYIQSAIVDEKDANTVSKFLSWNELDIPLLNLDGLAESQVDPRKLEQIIEGDELKPHNPTVVVAN